MPLSPWILQILILATGIHFFLRFVRTTRGSRLIRGLLMTVAVGFVGLWWLSKALDLEELAHLLRGSTGFVLIAIVIVFQQEVRRAIAQLGSTSFVGRLVNPAAGDALRRAVRAARSMAARRCGALVAFERQTPLQGFLEAGTTVDAAVTPQLLETIFHPGSALHDGGVVIRRDRVTHAGCIFPLPEQASIDPRLGTRHRAAMGLSEESDAVVLVVSEETGAISLAKGGQLRTVISPDEVEDELRRLVEGGEGGVEEEQRGSAGWRRDLLWLPASILLAAGILYVSHQDIRTTKDFVVSISDAPYGTAPQARAGEILVVLPGEGYQLVAGEGRQEIQVVGSRSQLEQIGGQLSGLFTITDAGQAETALLLPEVSWQRPVIGLDYEWASGRAPLLRLGRFGERRVAITGADLTVDATHLNNRYEVFLERVTFDPEPILQLRGPSAELERPLAELLEPVLIARTDLGDVRQRLRLRQDALDAGFQIEGVVQVTVPIAPARRDLGTVTKEIALVSLDPTRADEIASWSLPAHAQTARFRIEAAGLIPAGSDPGSTAYRERVQAIRNYVEGNLRVFVDLSEIAPESEGQSLSVRHLLRVEWRAALDSLVGIGKDGPGGREGLEVILESDQRVRLERRQAPAAREASSAEDNGN